MNTHNTIFELQPTCVLIWLLYAIFCLSQYLVSSNVGEQYGIQGVKNIVLDIRKTYCCTVQIFNYFLKRNSTLQSIRLWPNHERIMWDTVQYSMQIKVFNLCLCSFHHFSFPPLKRCLSRECSVLSALAVRTQLMTISIWKGVWVHGKI